MRQTQTLSRSTQSAAVRAFLRIAEAWQLGASRQSALLGMSASTYHRAVANPESVTLSRDQLERVSHVLGIYKALHILLPIDERADAWVHRPNDAFGGQTAADRMTSGSFTDLVVVRQYLDGERGW